MSFAQAARTFLKQSATPCCRAPQSASLRSAHRAQSSPPIRCLGKRTYSTPSYYSNPTSTPLRSSFSPQPSFERPSIRPAILFSFGISITAFTTAALYTQYDTDKRLHSLSRSQSRFFTWKSSDIERDLSSSRIRDLVSSARTFVSKFSKESRWPTILAENYVNLTEAQRTCLGIIALQTGIFIVWQVPAARRLHQYLLHDPLVKGRSITLLTSIFSHKTATHFLFNSIALYTIGPSAISYFQARQPRSETGAGPRSTSRYEFIAFFIAAGLASSLLSHIWSLKILLPWFIRTRMTSKPILPSLGASGAIYSALAVTALWFPQASVALIFLPFIPIPIGTAFASMMTLDLIGIIRGWQMFDHVAHLGGAFFGIAYYFFGHEWFERFRAWLKGLTSARHKEGLNQGMRRV